MQSHHIHQVIIIECLDVLFKGSKLAFIMILGFQAPQMLMQSID